MGKAHTLGLQSTLEFGPRSPAAPHLESHPTDTNLHSVLCCARLGAAGCIGGVVIATLPNSCAKGHGERGGRPGELPESWRTER